MGRPPTSRARRERAQRRASLLLGALLAASCNPGAGTDAPPTRLAVNYGAPDHEHEATVMLQSSRANCSGSVVAPNVVVTANHCVDGSVARDWEVLVGQIPVRDPTLVGAEIASPGPFTDWSVDDIALIVVRGALPTPTYVAAVDLEEGLLDSEVTIVGYGLDEDGDSGRRLMGRQRVTAVEPFWLELQGMESANSGDSGGTVLDARGQVIGVISRGGPGVTIATRVDTFRWLVDPVLRDNGGCIPGDPEACDGYDNDCDGEVDEGCLTPYEPCEDSARCTTGLCAEVAGERLCTRECVPGEADPCGEGAYCAAESCAAGLCRPGSAGSARLGDPCEDDRDCASLLCGDLPAGSRRCTELCVLDGLDCPVGSACAAVDGDCGLCVPADEADFPRGLGEPCDGEGDCRSGRCTETGVCAATCAAGEPCPAGTHCRDGVCWPGDPAEAGEPCVGPADCASGICAEGSSICTEACGAGDPCPPRWSCDFESGRCEPLDVPLGGACDPEAGAACLLGECLEHDGEFRCARPCEAACPPGFECVEDAGGDLCWPVREPVEGCSCAAAGATRTPPLPLRALVSTLGLAPTR